MCDTNRDWALCVGIGSYTTSSGLEELPGALNDAKAIHHWIVDRSGGAVPPEQAKLILSPGTQNEGLAEPAAHLIESFLRARYRDAEENRQNGDGFSAGRRLWLYFSGHGIGFPDDDNDTGLLAADALPKFRDFSHVAGMAWAEVFRVTKAFDEVVLFMDCCRLETNRTSRRPPAVQRQLADPEGKMMAAFAVSPSKAAFESNSAEHGVPRGKFTVALEELLKTPRKRPITAREFLVQLESKTPDFDPYPPRAAKSDFEFLSAREGAEPSTDAPLLIAHGETTAGLASDLAEALQTPVGSAQIRWEPSVIAESNPDAFTSVRKLVVTRDVNMQELRELIERVQPKRTVLFTERDPGVSDLPGVQFVLRPDMAMLNLSEQTDLLAAALKEAPGFLNVQAMETVAKIRVWDEQGRSTASEFGNIERIEVAPGAYKIRAALGAHYVERTVEVRSGETTSVALPALPLRLPCSASLLNWEAIQTGASNERTIYEGRIGSSPLFFSAPRIAGWRLEAFSRSPDHAVDFSVRLVPDSHPPGAPHEMDSMRESLKLALTERSWDATTITVQAVATDPVCALLAAALRLKCGEPHDDFTAAAAALLGDDDVNVKLLHGAATIDDPPLLSFLWHFRLKGGQLKVTPDSNADQIIGRLQLTEPWLTWTAQTRISDRNWLGEVANATWLGRGAECRTCAYQHRPRRE
ncbi:MAG: caspase family protein [Planctomycetaceae bacterium]